MISYIGTLRPPAEASRGFHIAVNKSKHKAALFGFFFFNASRKRGNNNIHPWTLLLPKIAYYFVYFINFFPTLAVKTELRLWSLLLNYRIRYLWYRHFSKIISLFTVVIKFYLIFISQAVGWSLCMRQKRLQAYPFVYRRMLLIKTRP